MTLSFGRTQHTLLLCGGLLAILYFAGPVLLPFILGVFIAWLFLRPTLWLQQRGIDRRISAGLLTLFFCGLVAIIITFLVPGIIAIVQRAIEALPEVIPRLTTMVEDLTNMPVTEPLENVIEDVGDGDVSALVEPATKATPILLSLVGSTLNMLLLVMVTPFAIFYMLADWSKLNRGLKSWLPSDTHEELNRIWDVSKDRGMSYIRGRGLVVLSMGVVHVIGLSLVGLDEAIGVGVLAGLSVIIPVIGNLFVLGLALVIALLQFDSLWPLAAVAAVFAIAQIVEMVIVEPYLLGDTMDMHPFVVLLVLMLGGHLMGIVGAIIALPLTAILVALLDAYRSPEEAQSHA